VQEGQSEENSASFFFGQWRALREAGITRLSSVRSFKSSRLHAMMSGFGALSIFMSWKTSSSFAVDFINLFILQDK
jgi:hypothetical protein